MMVIVSTNVSQISEVLKKFWGSKSGSDRPRFSPVLCYTKAASGRVAGFAYLHDIHDGYFREISIDELFVAPHFRRQGHGTMLVRRAIEYAKSQRAGRIFAEFNESDAAARAVCVKAGLKINRKARVAGIVL